MDKNQKDILIEKAKKALKEKDTTKDGGYTGPKDSSQRLKEENERLKKELEEEKKKSEPSFSSLLSGADPEKIEYLAQIDSQLIAVPEGKLQDFADTMKRFGVDIRAIINNRNSYKVNNEKRKIDPLSNEE